MDERKELDPKLSRTLKKVVKRHHTRISSRVKARKGLGKHRYR